MKKPSRLYLKLKHWWTRPKNGHWYISLYEGGYWRRIDEEMEGQQEQYIEWGLMMGKDNTPPDVLNHRIVLPNREERWLLPLYKDSMALNKSRVIIFHSLRFPDGRIWDATLDGFMDEYLEEHKRKNVVIDDDVDDDDVLRPPKNNPIIDDPEENENKD